MDCREFIRLHKALKKTRKWWRRFWAHLSKRFTATNRVGEPFPPMWKGKCCSFISGDGIYDWHCLNFHALAGSGSVFHARQLNPQSRKAGQSGLFDTQGRITYSLPSKEGLLITSPPQRLTKEFSCDILLSQARRLSVQMRGKSKTLRLFHLDLLKRYVCFDNRKE